MTYVTVKFTEKTKNLAEFLLQVPQTKHWNSSDGLTWRGKLTGSGNNATEKLKNVTNFWAGYFLMNGETIKTKAHEAADGAYNHLIRDILSYDDMLLLSVIF
jgi:hypothetical protein